MKNCAFYRASATTLFFPDFSNTGKLKFNLFFKEDFCLINTKQPSSFDFMLLFTNYRAIAIDLCFEVP